MKMYELALTCEIFSVEISKEANTVQARTNWHYMLNLTMFLGMSFISFRSSQSEILLYVCMYTRSSVTLSQPIFSQNYGTATSK